MRPAPGGVEFRETYDERKRSSKTRHDATCQMPGTNFLVPWITRKLFMKKKILQELIWYIPHWQWGSFGAQCLLHINCCRISSIKPFYILPLRLCCFSSSWFVCLKLRVLICVPHLSELFWRTTFIPILRCCASFGGVQFYFHQQTNISSRTLSPRTRCLSAKNGGSPLQYIDVSFYIFA